MNCLFQDVPDTTDTKGRRRVACSRCGQKVGPTADKPEKIVATCKAGVPAPGDELRKLIKLLGFKAKAKCGCGKIAWKMNQWGCDGCLEPEHFAEIVKQLKKGYAASTWAEVAAGGFAALTSGVALELNWADPIPSLVKLAIERARADG